MTYFKNCSVFERLVYFHITQSHIISQGSIRKSLYLLKLSPRPPPNFGTASSCLLKYIFHSQPLLLPVITLETYIPHYPDRNTCIIADSNFIIGISIRILNLNLENVNRLCPSHKPTLLLFRGNVLINQLLRGCAATIQSTVSGPGSFNIYHHVLSFTYYFTGAIVPSVQNGCRIHLNWSSYPSIDHLCMLMFANKFVILNHH